MFGGGRGGGRKRAGRCGVSKGGGEEEKNTPSAPQLAFFHIFNGIAQCACYAVAGSKRRAALPGPRTFVASSAVATMCREFIVKLHCGTALCRPTGLQFNNADATSPSGSRAGDCRLRRQRNARPFCCC